MNFKPRFLIETIENGATERTFAATARTRADADILENAILNMGLPAFVTDLGTLHRASTPEGARARGYYGLNIRTGVHTLSYVQGKIDRMADEALDGLDDLVEQMTVGA